MGLDGRDGIFKIATSRKVDYVGTVTLFQAMSGFMNPSRGSGWDRRDLQTSNFR